MGCLPSTEKALPDPFLLQRAFPIGGYQLSQFSWAVGLSVLKLVKSWWTRMGWSSTPYTISIYWNSAHFKGPAQFPAGSVSSSICLYIHVARMFIVSFVIGVCVHYCLFSKSVNNWRQGSCLIALIVWGQGLLQGRCLDLICWMNEWRMNYILEVRGYVIIMLVDFY